MGKALGKIDFLRFFNKNFLTKIDIDMIFFWKIAYELGAIITVCKKKSKQNKNQKTVKSSLVWFLKFYLEQNLGGGPI